MRKPWTHEELEALRRNFEASAANIEATEQKYPDLRPLPPLSEEETLRSLQALGGYMEQPQSLLLGQLLAQYRMSIEARMLGKEPGRYFVLAEEDLRALGEIEKW